LRFLNDPLPSLGSYSSKVPNLCPEFTPPGQVFLDPKTPFPCPPPALFLTKIKTSRTLTPFAGPLLVSPFFLQRYFEIFHGGFLFCTSLFDSLARSPPISLRFLLRYLRFIPLPLLLRIASPLERRLAPNSLRHPFPRTTARSCPAEPPNPNVIHKIFFPWMFLPSFSPRFSPPLPLPFPHVHIFARSAPYLARFFIPPSGP